MPGRYAILWTLHGSVYAGSLKIGWDRLELRGRGRVFAIPFDVIAQFTIERGPAARLKGLPVLTLYLAEGDVIRLASLEGVGVLHEVCAVLAPPRALRAV
jgi:hypothetical protein